MMLVFQFNVPPGATQLKVDDDQKGRNGVSEPYFDRRVCERWLREGLQEGKELARRIRADEAQGPISAPN
jgi:hypothetical protein